MDRDEAKQRRNKRDLRIEANQLESCEPARGLRSKALITLGVRVNGTYATLRMGVLSCRLGERAALNSEPVTREVDVATSNVFSNLHGTVCSWHHRRGRAGPRSADRLRAGTRVSLASAAIHDGVLLAVGPPTHEGRFRLIRLRDLRVAVRGCIGVDSKGGMAGRSKFNTWRSLARGGSFSLT